MTQRCYTGRVNLLARGRYASYNPDMNVKTVREQLGLTQAEMAQRMLVSQAQVSRWENGIDRLRPWAVHRLAELAPTPDEGAAA